MKHRILFSLIVILSFTCITPAHAGFIMKHNARVADSSTATAVKETMQLIQTKGLVNTLHDYRSEHKSLLQRPGSSSGWEGIVALVCGILGLFLGFPAILAVIFGAMGMGRNKRHHGMAVAGFVLGLIVTIILLLAIILALAFFSWII
jgi:hypothetical protein